MIEFFTLQNHILSIHNTNEVCFKPLSPDFESCATQSIFQWWQNDLEKFSQTFNTSSYNCAKNTPDTFSWHDHFMSCSVNPASIDDGANHLTCLGEYGGPAFPFVALGGSPKNDIDRYDYSMSEALVMTLENNNFEDRGSVGYEKALIWERDFLKLMGDFESEFFNVAYFSERSVEDEIDRAGNSDLPLFFSAQCEQTVKTTLIT